MSKSLSSIIAELENNPNIATLRVETWRSLKMAYIVYQMATGATLTALYRGPNLATLTLFDPTVISAKERQSLIDALINEYNEKQMKVARMLNVSQSTISLDLTMMADGLSRHSTKPRLASRMAA